MKAGKILHRMWKWKNEINQCPYHEGLPCTALICIRMTRQVVINSCCMLSLKVGRPRSHIQEMDHKSCLATLSHASCYHFPKFISWKFGTKLNVLLLRHCTNILVNTQKNMRACCKYIALKHLYFWSCVPFPQTSMLMTDTGSLYCNRPLRSVLDEHKWEQKYTNIDTFS